MNKILKFILLYGILIILSDNLNALNINTDSVLCLIHSMPQDSTRLYMLKEWTIRTADTPEEVIFLDAMQKEAEFQKNLKYLFYAHRNKVRYYYNKIDIDNAIAIAEPAIALFQKHKQLQYLFELKSMIINLHTWNEEYETALFKGKTMYKEAKSLKCKEGMYSACFVLGYANYVSGRYQDAISWYKQTFTLPASETDKMEIEIYISECYFKTNHTDSAKVHLHTLESLLYNYEKKHPSLPDEYLSSYWLWFHIGNAIISLSENRLNETKYYLDQASADSTKCTSISFFEVLHFTYSDYYSAIGEYKKALEAIEKGVSIQKLQGAQEDTQAIYRKASIFYKMGNYQEATKWLQKGIQLVDSLNSTRFNQQTKQLSTIYEIDLLEIEQKKQTSNIHILSIVFASLCLFMILLIIFFIKFRRLKDNLSIATQKACEVDLNTSEFLTNMRKEIQVFLQEVSRLSDLLIHVSKKDERKQYASLLRTNNDMIQQVIFNVLDVSKIESDQMKLNYSEVELNSLMIHINNEIQGYLNPDITLNYLPNKEIKAITDSTRLTQIITTFLQYVIHHTLKGKISFGYTIQKKNISFFISHDNWIISAKEQRDMFDRLAQTSERLQDMNLGLIVCKELISKMGGSISITSTPQAGTCIEFCLPLSIKQNNHSA